MFDDYLKKIEKLTDDAPKIFRKVAVKGAVFFENKAKEITDLEHLVDTGNYKRNWTGKAIKNDDVNIIVGSNDVEYASHLEYGHKLRNGRRWKGRFVGDRSLQETAYYCLTQLDNEWQKLVKRK